MEKELQNISGRIIKTAAQNYQDGWDNSPENLKDTFLKISELVRKNEIKLELRYSNSKEYSIVYHSNYIEKEVLKLLIANENFHFSFLLDSYILMVFKY